MKKQEDDVSQWERKSQLKKCNGAEDDIKSFSMLKAKLNEV